MNIDALKAWFLSEKRDLPWRNNTSPYAVWISEVMLQQTQVAVVIPYFHRWMKKFPTIEDLAKAPLDEVIKAWEGLGYYSRARNLAEGAKMVCQQFEGKIPQSKELLAKIKGLGPYTIGAILSFAFKQRAAAVDGNVIRVFTRYFAISENCENSSTKNLIWHLAEKYLPEKEPWLISEGWIELGAKICTKKPKCTICPLKESCKAYLEKNPEKYPVKIKKQSSIKIYRLVAVITCKDLVLIERGKKGKIMSDLHQFPYLQTTKEVYEDPEPKALLDAHFKIKSCHVTSLKEVSHTFTKYRCHLRPIHLEIDLKQAFPDFLWMKRKELKSLAFSSGHRQIVDAIS